MLRLAGVGEIDGWMRPRRAGRAGERSAPGATSGGVDACGCQLEVDRPRPESGSEPHI